MEIQQVTEGVKAVALQGDDVVGVRSVIYMFAVWGVNISMEQALQIWGALDTNCRDALLKAYYVVRGLS